MDRWKKRAAVALGLGLAGLAELLWLRRDQPGRVLDFQPVTPSRVLVERRDIHPDVPAVYLELDEAQKGVVWRRKLPHAHASPNAWSALPNAVATAGVYVVRTVSQTGEDRPSDRTPILQGFRAEDGALLWTVAPMGDRRDTTGRSFGLLDLTLFAKDDLVLSAYGQESAGDGSNSGVLLAIDARTGVERWRASLGDASTFTHGPAWIRGGSLVVFTWTAFSVIDLATGKTRVSARSDGRPCVTDRVVWFASGGELRELALDDLAQRTLPRPSEASFALQGACARRGGEIWAHLSDRSGGASEGGHVTRYPATRLVAFDPATGTVRRQIELGPVEVGAPADESIARMAPDEVPLSGEANRFLPLIVHEAGAPYQLVMVDLDEARIAWKTAPSERFVHAHLLREGRRHFLHESKSSLFAALDGDTGRLLSAIAWPASDNPTLAQGSAWIRSEWSVVSLDGATMKPIWSTDRVELADRRAEAEALLEGAPR
jgi:outer membrane protein assembly factor BamB